MLSTIIQPQFGDTDCFGHVNNSAIALWFETARNPLFRIFVPDLNFKLETFPLIIAHTDYVFVEQLVIQHEVEIRSWVSHIGSKSFTVYHQAWQKGHLRANGSAVAVHYDVNTKQSIPLPADKKKQLQEYLLNKQKSPRMGKKRGKED